MNISEVIKKVTAIEGIADTIGEEAVSFLKEYKTSNSEEVEKKLKEAEAKAARILDEKKKIQEKFDVAAAELEEAKTEGMPEVEKMKRLLEQEKKAREKAEQKQAEAAENLKQTTRKNNLSRIASNVKFLDTIPSEMRDFAINKAFENIEDFNDAASIQDAMGKFKEAHKGILQAEQTPEGGGSKKSDGSVSDANKRIQDMTTEERAAQLTGRK